MRCIILACSGHFTSSPQASQLRIGDERGRFDTASVSPGVREGREGPEIERIGTNWNKLAAGAGSRWATLNGACVREVTPTSSFGAGFANPSIGGQRGGTNLVGGVIL